MVKTGIMVMLTLMLSGCAGGPQQGWSGKSGRQAYLSGGGSPGCLQASSVKNTLAPPQLYQGMVACVKAGRFDDGVLLFALAGADSYFDQLRLSSDEATQAHSSMLGEALHQLNDGQRQAFWQAVNGHLGDKIRRAALCRQIAIVGKPGYLPTYQRQAADGAATGRANATGEDSLWKSAMSGYLHCATDVVSIH